jgi:hypothetical protein
LKFFNKKSFNLVMKKNLFTEKPSILKSALKF